MRVKTVNILLYSYNNRAAIGVSGSFLTGICRPGTAFPGSIF